MAISSIGRDDDFVVEPPRIRDACERDAQRFYRAKEALHQVSRT
jgi:hypothetical protein